MTESDKDTGSLITTLNSFMVQAQWVVVNVPNIWIQVIVNSVMLPYLKSYEKLFSVLSCIYTGDHAVEIVAITGDGHFKR